MLGQKKSSEAITVSKIEEKATSVAIPNIMSVMYEVKVPFIQTDDFGNEVTLYRKEIVTEDSLLQHKQSLLDQVAVIDEKLSQIDALK